MPTQERTITFNEKTYSLDEHGFLFPPEQWDENFANGMAETLEIYGGMTEKHWAFIRYLRKKFIEEETVPVVVIACAENKLRLREFKRLFPTGYHRGACKIAGINHEFMYKTNYWLTYETSAVLKSEYKMTPRGFLEDFNQWDEHFAELVIREWKLAGGLTDRHRRIIKYLRNYYIAANNIPAFYETCKANRTTPKKFRELFPGGYRRGACRIAGLPWIS
jgi:tRNA 2-thiouridine synthesizing protein E